MSNKNKFVDHQETFSFQGGENNTSGNCHPKIPGRSQKNKKYFFHVVDRQNSSRSPTRNREFPNAALRPKKKYVYCVYILCVCSRDCDELRQSHHAVLFNRQSYIHLCTVWFNLKMRFLWYYDKGRRRRYSDK